MSSEMLTLGYIVIEAKESEKAQLYEFLENMEGINVVSFHKTLPNSVLVGFDPFIVSQPSITDRLKQEGWAIKIRDLSPDSLI